MSDKNPNGEVLAANDQPSPAVHVLIDGLRDSQHAESDPLHLTVSVRLDHNGVLLQVLECRVGNQSLRCRVLGLQRQESEPRVSW